jgi:quercetin dioxygenase-like cupin family protein
MVSGVLAMAAMVSLFFAHPQAEPQLLPKVIKLDAGGPGYLRVLGGPPETSSMRSGLVILAPGAAVGKHNTDQFEELIVVFEGRAEVRITGRPPLAAEGGTAAYCPPHTEHDVINVGPGPLRYLYVVALEKKP